MNVVIDGQEYVPAVGTSASLRASDELVDRAFELIQPDRYPRSVGDWRTDLRAVLELALQSQPAREDTQRLRRRITELEDDYDSLNVQFEERGRQLRERDETAQITREPGEIPMVLIDGDME